MATKRTGSYGYKLFGISSKLIKKYISYICVMIKTNKDTNSLMQQADEDYDMYELLFFESLNEAFKCNKGTTTYDKETLEKVGEAIKQLLEEDNEYGYCILHRKDFIRVCFSVFKHVVEEARNRYDVRDMEEN